MGSKKRKFIDYYGLESIFNYPFICACIFFLVYWGAPVLVEIFIYKLRMSVITTKSIEIFSSAYTNDTTHLIFAIVVSLGTYFATKLCGLINNNEDKINCRRPCRKDVHKKKNFFIKLSNSHTIKFIALLAGVFTAIVIVNIISTKPTWWGVDNNSINVAGMIFVMNTSLMVFFGILVFIQISLRSFMTSNLAKNYIYIDFFHPDGCNGQKNVGKLIMLGWLLSILCISSIFILYYFGYMGIEESIIPAVVAIILILLVPMISIVPLWAIVKSVGAEKVRLIKLINEQSKVHIKLKNKKDKKLKSSNLPLSDYFTIRSYLESANVWPFNLKAISFAIIAYIIQSLLVLDQLSNVIVKWW